MDKSTQLCQSAKALDEFGPLIAIHWAQIVMSCSTLIFLAFVLRVFVKKKLVLHVNFKIVLMTTGCVYFVQSFVIVVRKLHMRFQYSFSSDNCQGVLERWKCIAGNFFTIYCVIAFCVCHLALTVERACATCFLQTYERVSKVYVLLSVCFGGVAIFGWLLWVYWDEDLLLYVDYCMATSSKSSGKLLITYWGMLAVDCSCTLADSFLYLLSRKRLKQACTFGPKHRDQLYELSTAYQLRENKLTTSLVFPLSVAHSVFILFYLGSATVIRLVFDVKKDPLSTITALESVHILVCVYEVLTLAMLLWLHRKQTRNQQARVIPGNPKTEGDLYFKLLASQMQL